MIQKTFTEGICLENEGPVTIRSFRSSYSTAAEKSYITVVSLEPKLIPKRTFFTLDGVLPKSSSAVFNRSCSLTNGGKSYGSSVSMDRNSPDSDLDCDYPYYQSIELEPRLVAKGFSETVHHFPRSDVQSCRSTLTYDPQHVRENYVVGLKVEKVKEVVLSSDRESEFTSSVHIHAQGDCGPLGDVREKFSVDEPDYVNVPNGV